MYLIRWVVWIISPLVVVLALVVLVISGWKPALMLIGFDMLVVAAWIMLFSMRSEKYTGLNSEPKWRDGS